MSVTRVRVLKWQTPSRAIGLSTADGRALAGAASYDAVSRTVTVRPDAPDTTSVVVRVDTGLRDIRGESPPDALRIAVTLHA